jgi:hypothetical protein
MNEQHLKWTKSGHFKEELLGLFNEETFSVEKAKKIIFGINSNSCNKQQRQEITRILKCLSLLNKFNLDNRQESEIISKEQNLISVQTQMELADLDKSQIDQNFCTFIICLIESEPNFLFY